MLRILGSVSLLYAAGLLAPVPGTGSVWFVAADGSGDAPTIQAALDSAAAGDVIELGSGAFRGTGNRDIVVDKAVTLRSRDGNPATCVLDAEGTEAEPHWGLSVRAPDPVTIERISVTGAFHGDGGGMMLEGSEVDVRHCWIYRNEANVGGGLAVFTLGATIRLDGLLIVENRAIGGAGIAAGQSAVYLTNCTISSNHASVQGGGAQAGESGSLFFESCILWGNCANGQGDDLFVSEMGGAWIHCSDIRTEGVLAQPGAILMDEGDWLSVDPELCAPAACGGTGPLGDYHVASTSICLPAHNPCGVLLGCFDEGCSATPVLIETWARLKGRYGK